MQMQVHMHGYADEVDCRIEQMRQWFHSCTPYSRIEFEEGNHFAYEFYEQSSGCTATSTVYRVDKS